MLYWLKPVRWFVKELIKDLKRDDDSMFLDSDGDFSKYRIDPNTGNRVTRIYKVYFNTRQSSITLADPSTDILLTPRESYILKNMCKSTRKKRKYRLNNRQIQGLLNNFKEVK